MKIDPKETQARVVARAREMAREHLRKGESFVWNATNLSRQVRSSCIALFADYHAQVRIVYVEASPAVYRRKNEREAPIPGAVMKRLLDRWETPDLTEAHRVDYVVTLSGHLVQHRRRWRGI